MISDESSTADGLSVEYAHAKADNARRQRESRHPRYRKLIDDAIERAKAGQRPALTLLNSLRSPGDARHYSKRGGD